MSNETTLKTPPEVWDPKNYPDLTDVVTEDGKPLDSYYQGIQQRLLVRPLYDSWPGPGEGRKWIAAANVGVFYKWKEDPIVPDAFLSLDVEREPEFEKKENRSYFVWLMGKGPDVVIEIVSNREGGEDDRKFRIYARAGAPDYVIFDPRQLLGPEVLRIYEYGKHRYRRRESAWFEEVGLGLTIWQGTVEGLETDWLRWCDVDGNIILDGAERADTEKERADAEKKRANAEKKRADAEKKQAEAEKKQAEAEKKRADAEQKRADKLAAKLRELGEDPTKL